MLKTRRVRRLAIAATTVMIGALLPAVLATTPATAADACLSETPTGGFLGQGQTRCDDVTQPTTTITGVDPVPNAKGYLNVNHVSFTFSGAYTDADVDPIKFQCQFYATAAAPSAWSDCTSPMSYSNLTDSKAVAYTFRVRAVDSGDNAQDATQTPAGDLFGSGAASDVPDYDETPEAYSFRTDTQVPDTYILNTPPYDADNPDWPMLLTQSPQFRLAATEAGVSYACTINDVDFPCADGINTFNNLTPGDKTLSVTGTDIAGNVDPGPATTTFAIPSNLTTTKKAWTRLKSSKYIGGDYLQTKTEGATLTFNPGQFQELRLIASTGPKAGQIQLELSNKVKFTVNLASKKTERQHVFVIRSRFSALRSGPITITVLSSKKVVALDGFLAH